MYVKGLEWHEKGRMNFGAAQCCNEGHRWVEDIIKAALYIETRI